MVSGDSSFILHLEHKRARGNPRAEKVTKMDRVMFVQEEERGRSTPTRDALGDGTGLTMG